MCFCGLLTAFQSGAGKKITFEDTSTIFLMASIRPPGFTVSNVRTCVRGCIENGGAGMASLHNIVCILQCSPLLLSVLVSLEYIHGCVGILFQLNCRNDWHGQAFHCQHWVLICIWLSVQNSAFNASVMLPIAGDCPWKLMMECVGPHRWQVGHYYWQYMPRDLCSAAAFDLW